MDEDANLNNVMADLGSEKGIEALRRKWSRLVNVCWVCAADVLCFILCRRENVETIRFFFSNDAVPDSFQTLYCILLPLTLFSRFMGARDRKLHKALPVVREVLSQFQMIHRELVDDGDLEILDDVNTHFLARLQMNAFEVMIRAWVPGNQGHKWHGSSEQKLVTRFQHKCSLPILECVQDMKTSFQADSDPWNQPTSDGESKDPSTHWGP
jgi:hypothetical protein